MYCSTYSKQTAVWRRILAGLAAVGLLAVMAGCQTVPPDEDPEDSELPWNAQQPWETAPGIPGMSGNGGY